jgi:hypothetical protein
MCHTLPLSTLSALRQVKEYVPPPPEAADVSVPTNMSVDQLRAAAEAKRAALETWCRTAYGEVCPEGGLPTG